MITPVRRVRNLLLGLFLALFPPAAFGAGEGVELVRGVPSWPGPDSVGVRPMGMGNAGLALADGPEAFFINPAGMGFYNGSYIEAGFYFHPSADNRTFSVSLVDTKTNPILAGGASYSYYIAPRYGDGKYRSVYGHILRMGTALHSGKNWSLGLSLKYLYLTRPFFPPLSAFNLDVGFSWRKSWFGMAITGYNLIYNTSGETPIALGLGLAAGFTTPFRIAVDFILDFQSRQILKGEVGYEIRVGASYTIKKLVTIRAGYQFDQVRSGHFISFGASLKYRQLGVEAAFRQEVTSSELTLNRNIALNLLWEF